MRGAGPTSVLRVIPCEHESVRLSGRARKRSTDTSRPGYCPEPAAAAAMLATIVLSSGCPHMLSAKSQSFYLPNTIVRLRCDQRARKRHRKLPAAVFVTRMGLRNNGREHEPRITCSRNRANALKDVEA